MADHDHALRARGPLVRRPLTHGDAGGRRQQQLAATTGHGGAATVGERWQGGRLEVTHVVETDERRAGTVVSRVVR